MITSVSGQKISDKKLQGLLSQRVTKIKMNDLNLKSDLLKTIQISIQFLFNEKLKNVFYFFTCIVPDYVAHDISKEF